MNTEILLARLQQLEAEVEQLRRENAALRGSHQVAPVAQIDLGPDGRVLVATARAAELLRMDSAESLRGLTLEALFSPPQCAQLRECMAHLRQGADERLCTLRGPGQRGNAAIWLRAVLSRATGRFDGYSLVLTDITDIEINRRELAADVDLLEALLQVAGVEFFEWQAGGSFRVSAGYRQLVGVEASVPPSLSLDEWAARIHPEDRERLQRRWREAPSGPLPPAEYRVIGDDGRMRWIRSAAILRRDEHGRLEHMSGVARDVSAEHETRQLLAERAALVELIPDFLLHVAPDGRVIYMNAVAERFFRESTLQSLPAHLDQIPFVQNHRAQVDEYLHSVIDLGRQTHFSFVGEAHPKRPVFDVVATPIRNGEGQVAGALLAARDVSRLARAEEQARLLLQQLQTLLETARASIVMVNADGRITLVNQAFCHAVGATREAVLGRPMDDYCFAEDGEARLQALRTLISTGAVSFNWRMRKVDGTPCWFRVDGSMVGAPDGGRREFVFIGADIHLAEQERASLIERERWLDRVLSDAGIGAFRFSRLLRGGELVGAYAHLYQQATPHVVLPEELLSLVLPAHRERMRDELQRFLAAEGRAVLDYPVALPDGQQRWLRAYMRNEGLSLDQKGVLSSVVLDITEDRLRAAEREELQQQVYQAQKAESLGVMAGGLAHDLNNMLMAAIGQLNLALGAAPEQGELGQYLSTVESVLGRMEGLTERMLAYAGKSASRMEPVDAAALLDSMEPLLRASTGMHTRLRLEIAQRPLAFRGDQTQIEQVILNLVQNAVDAMGDRGGTVRVRADRVAASAVRAGQLQWSMNPSEHYVEVVVRDDGPGIPDATLRRIFEPFYTTKTTGRGLGLSVVQGIIKAHNGSIRVLSEVGIGTEFRIYLPLLVEALPEPAAAPALVPLSGPRPRLLAIDDDEDVLTITAMMLEQCGYEVVSYLSGDDAISDLRGRPQHYGAAVVDLTMPVKDGVTVVRELRQLRPDLPVLFVSGYSKEQAADLLTPDERTAFLRKPFRIDALDRALAQVLAAAGGR